MSSRLEAQCRCFSRDGDGEAGMLKRQVQGVAVVRCDNGRGFEAVSMDRES